MVAIAGAGYTAERNAGRLTIVRSEDEWTTKPDMGGPIGSEFGYGDRLFQGFRDGMVFDYGDWEARDLAQMLAKGYKAKQIETALTMPIMAAEHSITPIKGDKGEAEFLNAFWDSDPLNGGSTTTLQSIINLSTSAISFKRAYWELEFAPGSGEFEGKTVYENVGWRPQTTCRLARDAVTGAPRGFEQEPFYVGPMTGKNQGQPLYIPARRAFVYIHGQSREPLSGTSALEIPYWCYKTTQKLLFLWFQFLEGVSLPRTVVKASDLTTARQIATEIAKLKSSGVMPISVPGDPNSVQIDVLDSSGKGAEQFQQAISWMDQAAVNSVLAGFLNLTNADKAGGAYALSKDASDFFLQTREADAHELAHAIRKDLFGPLIRYNFGKDAKIPKFEFEPLSAEDKSSSVAMMTTLLTARDPAQIPDDFVSMLAEQVSEYLGLDGKKVAAAFDKAGKDFAAKKEAEAEQMAAQMGGAPPAVGAAAEVAGAVGVAADAVAGAQADQAGAALSDAQQTALAMIEGS